MVFYELFALVRKDIAAPTIREMMRTAGTTILKHGGVIRKIRNSGDVPLVKRYHNQGEDYYFGKQVIMQFDSNPMAQREAIKTLRMDPRVIRVGLVKLGDRLDEIVEDPAKTY
ncbi:hypothetical protein SAICODRAFT_17559 [Saitoella complicata NRRL Y-17804]|uniref:uncharacterized protein n=1 Tax=Saitoella complicata (strain BCRC 22490 / CBS 7301 / JCM 7358 / NBRC 10748 / NRRL Y-17804) TaxID=698492 RepID=UPI0008670CA9|nr:uncharacterized protein SAICODRAFT_17559 [Saitoella complicata NRRL Y-17804]ODQ55160.1 hypothetical protein SAICODRAFT_17559 [Saitoella complicata NRRL Y-17804]